MSVIPLSIKGAYTVQFTPHEDERGFFVRTYERALFEKHGLHREWIQESRSHTIKKGTVRGLHFQFPPHAETKLIAVTQGEIFVVVVDIRRGSPTFGKWQKCMLAERNGTLLYIPKGCAMGMCTVTEVCTMLYKMDALYVPESAGVIRWNDPDIGIPWPTDAPILSAKDAQAPSFQAFIAAHGGIAI